MTKCYIPTKKEYFEQFLNTKKTVLEIVSNNKKRFIFGDLIVDYFEKTDLYLVYVPDEYIDLPKGFLDVTDNPFFTEESIVQNRPSKIRPILEGTDGVGKTTFITELLKKGFICQDRSADIISKNMLFTIPMEKRAQIYFNAFKESKNPVIFIINTDKKELERRINKRAEIEGLCEFDDEAYRYGLLYRDTFIYMQKNNCLPNCFHLLDATGKTIEAVCAQIENICRLSEK